jgi:hypothetical protein
MLSRSLKPLHYSQLLKYGTAADVVKRMESVVGKHPNGQLKYVRKEELSCGHIVEVKAHGPTTRRCVECVMKSGRFIIPVGGK